MLEKMEKEGKLEQEQEAMLYLLVVELREDWAGARRLLAGPLGKILENSATYHLRCISKVNYPHTDFIPQEPGRRIVYLINCSLKGKSNDICVLPTVFFLTYLGHCPAILNIFDFDKDFTELLEFYV